jgi:tRNA threonylcarbamoyladenosine biosynthesis protein TsaE
MIEVVLPEERATLERAGELARVLAARDDSLLVIFLEGDLGAGKTTFVRGVLRALGVSGPIRSPTFTLLETYEAAGRTFAHLDLYRLSAPEIEAIGLRDLLTRGTVLFVEWPERGGAGALPPADVRVRLEIDGAGRRMRVTGQSEKGRELVQVWLR